MIDLTGQIKDKDYGLKSINNSLSITTALRPWLLDDLKSRALALNFTLIIIQDPLQT
jgi:hypothetical protein